MSFYLRIVESIRQSHFGCLYNHRFFWCILTTVFAVFQTNAQVVLTGTGFDILAMGDVSVTNANISGSLYAGSSISFTNASLQGTSRSNTPALYAVEDIDIKNSSIANGDVYYGNEFSLKNASIGYGFGAYQSGSSTSSQFSTNTVRQHFENLSHGLAGLTTNGLIQFESWGGLKLSGSQSVNVFNVTLGDYSNLSQIGISAPTGSTVIINILDSDVSKFAAYLSGVSASSVLFNFVNADSLDLKNNSFHGTYLAPFASITGSNGSFDGQLIGFEIDLSNFDFTSGPFNGNLPVSAIPEPDYYSTILGSVIGLCALLCRNRRKKIA